MKFLYPSSFLKSTRVDEHFEDEVELLDTKPVLYSEYEDRLVLRGESLEGETVVYRGWIVSADKYSRMSDLVETAGGTMLVSPVNYAKSQFAEGWLNVFDGLTPETVVFPYEVSSQTLIDSFADESNAYVVKGSSKSLKHDWDNFMFAKSGSDVVRVVDNFRSQVSFDEESFILVRKFENWIPGELRVWWLNDRFVVDQHPNNETVVDFGEDFVSFLNSVVKGYVNSLDAVFVTTDFVRDVSGNFRLVEVGNGQVSGAHDFTKVVELFRR